MKVKILVEFEVPDTDDVDVAKSAADRAVFDYLSFCTITDVNPGRETCTVPVDGHGEFEVRIGDNN